MVQELVPFLPQALTTEQAALCVAAIAMAAILWAAGAVWSRGLLTLLAVARAVGSRQHDPARAPARHVVPAARYHSQTAPLRRRYGDDQRAGIVAAVPAAGAGDVLQRDRRDTFVPGDADAGGLPPAGL